MILEIGNTIGEYKLLAALGSGGSGRVFRVEHLITKRQEALKVLTDVKADTEEQRTRFLREIRLQASLDHPNIAAVHNAFYVGDQLVMSMELVDGESLQHMLKEGKLPLAKGIGYGFQLLAALSHAHAHGVIHRDISPANIMVTPDGTVKVTDFGLAKTINKGELTAEGAVLGSLHYMSPEQVRGLHAVDARSDIYSCGAVLYEVVTGRKPFEYESAFSLMRAQVEQPPVPPSLVNESLPDAVSQVILTALAKDPVARFPSANYFRAALEMACRPQAPAPPPEPVVESFQCPAPAPRPPGKRSGLGSAAAGLAIGFLVVALLVGGTLWLRTLSGSVGASQFPAMPQVLAPLLGESAPAAEPAKPAEVLPAAAKPRKRAVRRAETAATPAPLPKARIFPPPKDSPAYVPRVEPPAPASPFVAVPPVETAPAVAHANAPAADSSEGKSPVKRWFGKVKVLNPFRKAKPDLADAPGGS